MANIAEYELAIAALINESAETFKMTRDNYLKHACVAYRNGDLRSVFSNIRSVMRAYTSRKSRQFYNTQDITVLAVIYAKETLPYTDAVLQKCSIAWHAHHGLTPPPVLARLLESDFATPTGAEDPKPLVTSQESEKENEMAQNDIIASVNLDASVPVQEKTFVFGVDATRLSDDDVFGHISRLEQQIAALEKVENKPEKLKKKIEGLKANIKALIDFVDDRE